MRFLKKNPILSVICVILVAVLAIGGLSRIGATPLSFDQGDINEAGKFVESKVSIVTVKSIDCDDLTITPDFAFDGSFRIAFYGDNGYIGTSEELDVKVNVSTLMSENPKFVDATECRIIITPNGDSNITDAEVIKYAADLSITYGD